MLDVMFTYGTHGRVTTLCDPYYILVVPILR